MDGRGVAGSFDVFSSHGIPNLLQFCIYDKNLQVTD